MKIGQRFARMVATTFVYKHRTMAQQARAIAECVLQPTHDRIALNETNSKNRLVLFSPSDSGAEAYYALAQALVEDVSVTGINHFFINYPDKVTVDWCSTRILSQPGPRTGGPGAARLAATLLWQWPSASQGAVRKSAHN